MTRRKRSNLPNDRRLRALRQNAAPENNRGVFGGSGFARAVAIVQLRDRFRAGDCGAEAGLLHDLSHGFDREILRADFSIVGVESRKIRSIELFQRIDFRAVFLIGNDAVFSREIAGEKHCAIHVRRAGKSGVIILEKHAVVRERRERRRKLGRRKIRPHSIPDHDDDVFRARARGRRFIRESRRGCGRENY